MWLRALVWIMAVCILSFAQAEVSVRVLLAELSSPVTVAMSGSHRGYQNGVQTFETQSGMRWPLSASGSQVIIDGQAVGRSFGVEPTDGTFVSWEGRAYRGKLRFVASGNRLKIINVVGLESYLRGVVPAEMQASWELEALKAQAVAARTYTVTSLKPYSDYDICATTECQKYRGVEIEHARSDQAIVDTVGQVLTYEGRFARTYYHSDSGGVLASSAEVWSRAHPYLVAQTDIEINSPHRHWEKVIDADEVAASLESRGRGVGTVLALRILSYSESGRVTSLEITGSAGSTVLSGTRLTKLLREWGLKSTRFAMVSDLVARGDGWGHGVGMSQYGAKTLAQSGYGYAQILSFYYPDTVLQRLAQ